MTPISKQHNRKHVSRILIISMLFSVIGCASKDKKKTQDGAILGAAAGAVLGSILSKDKKKGALIGAALGSAVGAGIGHKLDEQAKELRKIAETKRTKNGIVTKLKGDITFAPGKARVTSKARKRILKMAKIIKKYPEDRLVITGHTDSTGSASINKELSKKRAYEVKRIFKKGGVPSKYIKIVGASSKKPLASNKTAKGRSKNRRVEIAISMVKKKKK